MATESLKLGCAWDDDFQELTDELLLGPKPKTPQRAPRSTSIWTGWAVKPKVFAVYEGKGSRSDVRGRLHGLVRKTSQVVVKVTGGGKTSRSIKCHLDNLSRAGQLTLRDQDGREITGSQAIEDLAWGWRYTGPAMDESGAHREAFNIVFSMPEGTDARAHYAAVKATAQSEFAGHHWVIVQPEGKPHVYAHICVKAEGIDGMRLNPRKADLQRWREKFAFELRQRGIEAEATRRVVRLNQERINKPWAVFELEKGNKAGTRNLAIDPKELGQQNPDRIARWHANEAEVTNTYGKIITALSKSDEAADRALAQKLRAVTVDRSAEKQRTAMKQPTKEIGRA